MVNENEVQNEIYYDDNSVIKPYHVDTATHCKVILIGAKSRQGKYYTACVIDLGYRKVFVSAKDMVLVREMLGMSGAEYSELIKKETEFNIQIN